MGGSVYYQLKFFSTTRVRRYLAVHDEIQASRGANAHPYMVHGVLFIPWDRRAEVHTRLTDLRQGFPHAIHYTELGVRSGPKYEAAKRWLDWFKTEGALLLLQSIRRRPRRISPISVSRGIRLRLPYLEEHIDKLRCWNQLVVGSSQGHPT
jgi:hypothetical protein